MTLVTVAELQKVAIRTLIYTLSREVDVACRTVNTVAVGGASASITAHIAEELQNVDVEGEVHSRFLIIDLDVEGVRANRVSKCGVEEPRVVDGGTHTSTNGEAGNRYLSD